MKKLLLLLIAPILCGSCLKHDVLKKEANTNFRESGYYLSGDFDSDFELNITDTSVTAVQNSNGDWLCKPVFTIQLSERFTSRLLDEWDGTYKLSVIRPSNQSNSQDFESADFSEKFVVTSMPSIICGGSLGFVVKLHLLTPSTAVIATTENNYVMPAEP